MIALTFFVSVLGKNGNVKDIYGAVLSRIDL